MLAVAIFDFHLSQEQFGRITPRLFWDLWERREMMLRRACYLSGIVASAVFNVARTQVGQKVFEPWDFLPRSHDDAQREEIILLFRRQINEIPPQHHKDARATMEARLKQMGRSDTEEILERVFAWIN